MSAAAGLLRKKAAASYLGASTRSLDRWIEAGNGPPFHLIGSRRHFLRTELDAWIANALNENTDVVRQSETDRDSKTIDVIGMHMARVG